MTTTVYFDLDGTLLDYDVPFSKLFEQTLSIDVTEDMVHTYSDQVLAGITQLLENPYEQAFDVVRKDYDLDVDPEALAADYIEKEATATRIPTAVRELVKAISYRHRTGILTNGDGRMQRRKIDKHDLNELVDMVIISNEVGVRKPNQEIFEEAKERLPAETFVYVGDTFEEDILPAREAGFKTIYVGKNNQPNAPVATRGAEELAALLLPLLGEDTNS